MARFRYFTLFLLLFPLAAPAALPTAPTTRPVKISGVENFAQVSPVLYRGAQPSAKGFAELKKKGIRTIVNLRSPSSSDSKPLKGLGLRYIHLPTYADKIGEKELLRFLKVVEDPANQPVFVHCQRGADRTGCAVATYRIVNQGWSVDDALAEMRLFRFNKKYRSIVDCLQTLDPEAVNRKLAEAEAPKLRVVP